MVSAIRHLAVWLTGVDWPLLAIGVGGAAGLATGTALLARGVAIRTGLPVVDVAALLLLLGLCLAGSAAISYVLSRRP